MKPLFITFEGSDKAGKTTQVQRFCDALRARGCNILQTREPGGTDVSEQIRRVVLDKNNEMGAACEMLLYAAARAEHVRAVIKPALAAGQIVVCDRFVDSSIAYQGYGRQLGAELVAAVNAPAVDGLVPDLTFFLLLDEAVASARRSALEQDRLEREQADFFTRVRQAYDQIIQDNPQRIVVVDASGTMEEVTQRLLAAYDARMETMP